VSIIHFKVEDVVQNLKGDIEELVPTYRDVIRTIQKELLEPVVTGTNKEATTQTAKPDRSIDPDAPRSQDRRDPLMNDPFIILPPMRSTGVGVDRNRYARFIVSAWAWQCSPAVSSFIVIPCNRSGYINY